MSNRSNRSENRPEFIKLNEDTYVMFIDDAINFFDMETLFKTSSKI